MGETGHEPVQIIHRLQLAPEREGPPTPPRAIRPHMPYLVIGPLRHIVSNYDWPRMLVRPPPM